MTHLNVIAKCPWCERDLMGYTEMTKNFKGMADGDISVCWGCKNMSIIEITLTMRKPTNEEMEQIRQHPNYDAVAGGILVEDNIDHAVHAIHAQVQHPRQEPPE